MEYGWKEASGWKHREGERQARQMERRNGGLGQRCGKKAASQRGELHLVLWELRA